MEINQIGAIALATVGLAVGVFAFGHGRDALVFWLMARQFRELGKTESEREAIRHSATFAARATIPAAITAALWVLAYLAWEFGG